MKKLKYWPEALLVLAVIFGLVTVALGQGKAQKPAPLQAATNHACDCGPSCECGPDCQCGPRVENPPDQLPIGSVGSYEIVLLDPDPNADDIAAMKVDINDLKGELTSLKASIGDLKSDLKKVLALAPKPPTIDPAALVTQPSAYFAAPTGPMVCGPNGCSPAVNSGYAYTYSYGGSYGAGTGCSGVSTAGTGCSGSPQATGRCGPIRRMLGRCQ